MEDENVWKAVLFHDLCKRVVCESLRRAIWYGEPSVREWKTPPVCWRHKRHSTVFAILIVPSTIRFLDAVECFTTHCPPRRFAPMVPIGQNEFITGVQKTEREV